MTTRPLDLRMLSRSRSKGFTLIELMVAVTVFLVIAGVAFSVFDKHMAMVTYQESLSGVNLSLRNATGQLQLDLQGAGENLLGTVSNTFATGVIIQNQVPAVQGGSAAACTPSGGTWAYPVPSACFDSLTIFDPPTCAANATTGQPPVLTLQNTVDVYSGNPLVAWDSNGGVPATDATCFKAGDELLIIQVSNGVTSPSCDLVTSLYCVGEVQITSPPSVSSPNLVFTYTPTAYNGAPTGCPGASCTDPQGILYNPNSGTNFEKQLQHNFQADTTYIVDVGGSSGAITYSVVVNPSNSADTQLQRCDVSGCGVLADQIIGFKVGAALWSNEATDQPDIANYFYDSSSYCNAFYGGNCNDVPLSVPADTNDPYDFSLIRAVRISLVGRTAPNAINAVTQLNNGFDNGPYLVQQSSVVVDLRNMTIGDYGN
ncbi:MAG: PulJ/GspJ family protein [Candidatus Acidiferrales bacterium]